MKYKLVLFFFIGFNSFLFSQEFRDQSSNEKISFVEIYSSKGDLIGVSDQNGLLNQNLKDKIITSNSKIITISRQFFENKELDINEFLKTKIISLKRNVIELQEVNVSKPKNSKYLKLKGYFRSVQINDNKPHYFNDGIVIFFVSLKTGKIKTKVLSNRSFEDKSITQLSKAYNFSIVGVPLFNDLIIKENLLKKYNLIEDKSKISVIDKIKSKTRGYLAKTNDNTELQLSIFSIEEPQIMKLFGMESKLDSYNISAVYSNIGDLGLKNILFFKEIRSYNLRKSKKDSSIQIDATHEFYLLEKKYVDKIDENDFNDNYSFITPSKYQSVFWKEIDNELYKPYPKSLYNAIMNMEEIK